MDAKKSLAIGIIVSIALALIIGGQYVGGYFLLHKLGLEPSSVGITTLYQYHHAYGNETGPVGKFIKLGLSISFLPIGLVVAAVLAGVLTRTAKVDKLFGEARFATDNEIKQAGLFYNPDQETKWPPVLLGRKGKRYVADYSQEYTSLSAQPGAGKGVSFVIPNLLNYTHSVVCMDPKLENFGITSGYRSKVMKQKVFLFSPDNEKFQTHCWNPLDYISTDIRRRLSQIKNLTAILIPAKEGENQSFFLGARKALDGILLYLMETPGEEQTMYRAYEINEIPIGVEKWIKKTVSDRDSGGNPLSAECVTLLMSYANEQERKFATTKGIIGTYLEPFADPLCRAATRKSDFNFMDLRKERISIYVGVSPGNIPKLKRLLNLFFSQAIMLNTIELPEEGPKDSKGNPVYRYQCLMLLDEFVSLGPVEIIRSSSGYTRAYNMRYAIVFQNKAQIFADECYGQAGGESLLDTFHNEVVFATEKTQDAEDYSKRLGNTTLKHRERSRTQSKHGNSSTVNVQRHSRALMLPQEVMRLPYEEQLIFKRGGRIMPIHCEKIVWYKDEYFKPRANMPAPAIPEMIFT